MTKKKTPSPNQEFGEFLDLLHYILPIDGKRLSVLDICHLASMSAETYERVKRAKV